MMHAHYDLEPIEAGIRKMFAETPDDQIDDDADVASAFRRSVDVEVAMTRFFLGEIMRGTDPNVTFDAISCVLANLIMNRIRGFGADDENESDVIDAMLSKVFNHVMTAAAAGSIEDRSDHAVTVSPVVSGQA